MPKKTIAVIMAAGSSRRMKNKTVKPFIIFKGKPLIWYSLYSFDKSSQISDIYVVVSEDIFQNPPKVLIRALKKIGKFRGLIAGGTERCYSVYEALKKISPIYPKAYVAIHDAARPFITEDIIDFICQAAYQYGAAAPGVPVVDTIKVINENNEITSHLSRQDLKAIQTPQIFLLSDLFKAYEQVLKAKRNVTDDTEVYAVLKKVIKILPGKDYLFKITYQKDLKLARVFYKKKRKLWT